MTGSALHRSPVATLVEMATGAGGEIISHRVEGDLHRLSRAELAARARRLAGALAAAGIAPGDHIATVAWTGHRHLEIAFATGGAGVVTQALDPGLHPDAVVRSALRTGARMVFFDLTFMPLIEEIAPRLPAATRFVALTDREGMPILPAETRLLCYEDLLASAPDGFDWPTLDERALGFLSTDGGEGRVPTPAATDREARGLELDMPEPDILRLGGVEPGRFELNRLEFDEAEIVLSAMPMARTGGWDVLAAAWLAGATLVFAGPWLDGGSLRALAEREGATAVAAPPRLWQSLLARLERDGAVLPRLRRAFIGGDAEIVAVRSGRDPRAAWTDPLREWGAGPPRPR